MTPMKPRPFKQVDVFTATPYLGNPLAVVLDGAGIDDAARQRFAQWTNLSETTFLLPPTDPTADYRVRIFTPGGELPFAGHPTSGSCHAWLQAGGKPKAAGRVVQQCAAGLVPLRREGERLAFSAPPLKRSAPSPTLLAKVAGALGLKAQQIVAAQVLDNGPVWFGLLLSDADTVLRLVPDHRMLTELGVKAGVAGVLRHEPCQGVGPVPGRHRRPAGPDPMPLQRRDHGVPGNALLAIPGPESTFVLVLVRMTPSGEFERMASRRRFVGTRFTRLAS